MSQDHELSLKPKMEIFISYGIILKSVSLKPTNIYARKRKKTFWQKNKQQYWDNLILSQGQDEGKKEEIWFNATSNTETVPKYTEQGLTTKY